MSTARTKKRAAEAAGFTIKLALGLVFISPLIIGLFFSFQTEQELMSYPLHLLPQHFTLENYQAVFAKVPLLLYLKNSVIVCLPFYMSNMSCWLRGIKSTSSVKNLSRCRSNHLTV